ncbi:FtsK/SpoIIIE domain-containing protein [Glutamicibacter arilaitensis]|uniref:FtsK/SpoIIIE domain-containing protein n=1 Tax=Glutamicibacter arilaitensis TaxID=256701 RepID=UPI00384EA080
MAKLDAAAQAFRTSHARLLGTLEAAQSTAGNARDIAYQGAQAVLEKQQAIARNQAAQAVTEHSLRARDIAEFLLRSDGEPLDVAQYIGLGHLGVDGSSSGVNSKISAPFLLPLFGHGNVGLEASAECRRDVIENILWRALSGTAPGQLDVFVYDPNLSSVMAPFSTLRGISDESLQVVSSASDFEREIRRLSGDIQRINEMLRGVSSSLIEFRAKASHPVERFKLVILIDYPVGIEESLHRQVMALAQSGITAGVAFVFASSPGSEGKPDWWREDSLNSLTTSIREQNKMLRWTRHPEYELQVPKMDSAALVREVDELVASAASVKVPSVAFERVEQLESKWTESSAERLRFSIGLAGPNIADVTLGDERDQRHNILITGAVGQGKSNLLKVIIHSLAQRYSPDELEFYLLDYKEGVTLYPMAPTPGSPDFLPHARVLGLESDREFGVAVLKRIEAEFARRSRLFRPFGDNIAKYRAAVPEAGMPRIVVMIDEFHMMFDPNDKTAEEAAQLLEGLARRGRSYGVHLILASQTISGVAALMTREDGIYAQFPIRLALKNSAQESFATLGLGNDGAARLRMRGEAILNLDYGLIDSNRQITVAVAQDSQLASLQRGWWLETRARVERPQVFDGGRRIHISDAVGTLLSMRSRLAKSSGSAVALLGYPIAVTDQPLGISLAAEPGRHLAILGAGEANGVEQEVEAANNAIGTLQAAAISLALQHPAGNAEFVSLDLLDEPVFARNNHEQWLSLMESIGYPVHRVTRAEVADYLQELVAELDSREAESEPRYILGFGLDRATALDVPDMFARKPSEDLQQILRMGSAKHVHLLGWWANAATFSSHIGFGGEGFIDALLMLRIDQSSVQEFLGPFVNWSVRENRGLLTDRTQLSEPTTVIPFVPVSTRDASVIAKTDWEV